MNQSPYPAIAARCGKLSPSPTLTLNAKANELKAAGKQVLNFAVGECDTGTPRLIIDAAKKALDAGLTRYSAPGGSLALRQAIARKLQRENSLAWEEDNIVAGMGAKELLFHLSLGLFGPGDEVIVPAPYWVSYTEQIMLAEATAVTIPISQTVQDRRYVLKPAMLEKVATPHTKAIILNFPNNPSGAIPEAGEMRELAAYLMAKPWWIISDEIYEYLVFEGVHRSLLNIEPRLKDRFIYLNGLSKGFFMTGWRVGYMAAPKAVSQVVRGLQGHSSTCLPPFIEAAAIAALDAGRSLVEPHLKAINERRLQAIRWVQGQPRADYIHPQGAFYLFLDLRQALATAKPKALTSLEFCSRLMEEYLVGAVPGEAFGAPGFIRISFAVAEDILRDGLARLGDAIARL